MVDKTGWEDIVRREAEPIAFANIDKKIHCPNCGAPMEIDGYYEDMYVRKSIYASNLMVCPQCELRAHIKQQYIQFQKEVEIDMSLMKTTEEMDKDFKELQQKYKLTDEDKEIIAAYDKVKRKLAFFEFECEVEHYEGNGYAENNNNRHLDFLSKCEIEDILDDYIERQDSSICWTCDEDIRNAIQDVTGIRC